MTKFDPYLYIKRNQIRNPWEPKRIWGRGLRNSVCAELDCGSTDHWPLINHPHKPQTHKKIVTIMTITQKFCLLPPDKLLMIFGFKKMGRKKHFWPFLYQFFFIGSSKIWGKKNFLSQKLFCCSNVFLFRLRGIILPHQTWKKCLCVPPGRD